MRILQLDVDEIEYEPIKPELAKHEPAEKKPIRINDALVMLVSIEKGDGIEEAAKAIDDAYMYMEKMKRKNLVIYPFAHLSSNLASPDDAMSIINKMRENAKEKGIEYHSSAFGWNKRLSMKIKGHPLAEQSKTYGSTKSVEGMQGKPRQMKKEIDTSIVRKSDISGLPDTDHRVIGEKLDLFSFQEVSPGSVYWHNNGLIIYMELLKFIRELLEEKRYKEVSMPALSNIALWSVSGHLDHFSQNMFLVDVEGERLGMKPMNCPSTILIYKSRKWSYKELPFRAACFDRLYRNEISGALTGLFRVREFVQDDAHIFLKEDQIEAELESVIELISRVYDTFGLKYIMNLSTMPENHLGDEKVWQRATDIVKKTLEKKGIRYEIKEGEGAFYGPKIDVDAFDSMGRKWQCGTVQVDFQLPIRFNLEYTGEDGKQHTPIIIHRALLGTLERFIGVMVEHYQSKFPTWLSPVQVEVIPLSEQHIGFAIEASKKIRSSGIRVELDESDRTLEYKIRDAQMRKIPYMIIVGKKEEESGKLAVRNRSGEQKFGVDIDAFIGNVTAEIKERKQTF